MSSSYRWAAPAAVVVALLHGAAAPGGAQEVYQPRLEQVSAVEQVSIAGAALSPDGRWWAFARKNADNTASLWAMPATGGPSVRLTSDGYWDDTPSWGPNGTLLYFRSTRSARSGDDMLGMVMPFDPVAGRATGPARQLTAELVSGPNLQASLDGQFVAYPTYANALLLRVIPATGGNARTVVALDQGIQNLTWTPEGDLLFTSRPDLLNARVVYRVAASGGTPVEIFRTDRAIVAVSPKGDRFALRLPGSTPRDAVLEVVDRSGRVLARYAGDANMRPVAFTPDGRRLVGTTTQVGTAIRVIPTAGGRPVDITTHDYYNWPAGWAEDGSEVRVMGTTADRGAILSVPRDGRGTGRTPALLPTDEANPSWLAVEGDYALYRADLPGTTERVRLGAISLVDGSRQILSENMRAALPFAVGRGGGYDYDGGEFLYIERHGQEFQLRSVWPGSEPRLRRSLPGGLDTRTAFYLHGDRVAWFEQKGDSAHLYIATDASQPPARLLSARLENVRCCRVGGAFSREGSQLVVQDMTDYRRMLLLDLSPDGRSVHRQRVMDTGAVYWYEPRWLPGDDAIALIAGYEGTRTHVVLMSLRDGEPPIVLTRDDPASKWGFVLSPDGRHIAYPGEVWQGGAVWTMDLSPTVVGGRERR
jgi:Tol biopolymer transport system component